VLQGATAASAAVTTAPPMTTSQGGTFQIASDKKATSPIPKSRGSLMALVQTGVYRQIRA